MFLSTCEPALYDVVGGRLIPFLAPLLGDGADAVNGADREGGGSGGRGGSFIARGRTAAVLYSKRGDAGRGLVARANNTLATYRGLCPPRYYLNGVASVIIPHRNGWEVFVIPRTAAWQWAPI